jgi:pyruvate/2-oxoglutarate dehydrogenase complex dihydrolipoamide acyltransferase (E2) component
LAVSGTEDVVVGNGDGGVRIEKEMKVTLSSDHRVVDGALAA